MLHSVFFIRFDVWTHRAANAQTKISSEFQANTYTANNQKDPSVTGLSSDNFVVIWSSQIQDGSEDGVYEQRFTIAAGITAISEWGMIVFSSF